MRNVEMNCEIYVMNDNKMIYKIVSFREADSNEYCLIYNLELVAGYDYIDIDNSDRQGFVSNDGFVDSVQSDCFTVYPINESLEYTLSEYGYKIIDIKNHVIHEFKTF